MPSANSSAQARFSAITLAFAYLLQYPKKCLEYFLELENYNFQVIRGENLLAVKFSPSVKFVAKRRIDFVLKLMSSTIA